MAYKDNPLWRAAAAADKNKKRLDTDDTICYTDDTTRKEMTQMKCYYMVIYNVGSNEIVYGYAETQSELMQKIENALEDGIIEFRVEYTTPDKI